MPFEQLGLDVTLYLTQTQLFGRRLNRGQHPTDAERSTCVLASQAIPSKTSLQRWSSSLISIPTSWEVSKISEPARDCRLDDTPRRPNLCVPWLVRYVNRVRIRANRKEILSVARRQDIGGSLAVEEWGCGIGNDNRLSSIRITARSYVASVFIAIIAVEELSVLHWSLSLIDM